MNVSDTAKQYRLLATRFLDADQAVVEHEQRFQHFWDTFRSEQADLLKDYKGEERDLPIFKEKYKNQLDQLVNQYGEVARKRFDARDALNEFIIQDNMIHIKRKLK